MRRVFVAALVAGGIAGMVFFAVQQAKLTPLILAAEVYETASEPQHSEGGHEPAEAAWEPANC